MIPTLLVTLFIALIHAQDHGSPNGVPIPVTVVDPNAPSPVNPTIAPDQVSFASWVNPDQLSPPTPTPIRPESTPGDIFVCTDADFTGTCEYFHNLTYECYNLDDRFRRQLTSIRPDKNQLCLFFDEDNCAGNADWIRWPGSGNMRGRRFDNRAASWKCSDDDCDGVQGPGGCTKTPDGKLKNQG
jgi:hypothetical protein